MAEIEFAKMHGLGNDFAVLDGISASVPKIDAQAVRGLADRRLGIGFDQLLLLQPDDDEDTFGYRIWNADGSEVAQCGNGARCAFAFLQSRRYCSQRCKLRTANATIEVAAGRAGPRASLGIPVFEPAAIPLKVSEQRSQYEIQWQDKQWKLAALAIGNPHAVIEVDDVTVAPVEQLGSFLNASELFPEQVNVSFVQRISASKVLLRVYERGVGQTPACGSAAAAAAVFYARAESKATQLEVEMNGGVLAAGWAGLDTPAWIEGKATEIFAGTMDISAFVAKNT